jgi:hypothetical protein
MSWTLHLSIKKILVVCIAASVLTACSITKPHEKAAQQQAQAAGLGAVDASRFDGTFVAPGTNFSQYKKLLVEQLDMDTIEIIQPSSATNQNRPWALSEQDKNYYQERYTQALISNLIADGRYTTAMGSAADVLRIKTRIVQIAPLATKDDSKGRPGIVKVYSEGSGTMTIEMSLYDSMSGKLVGIITDKRDLGKIWEENNRASNNRQVRVAFDAWLRKLRQELLQLSE